MTATDAKTSLNLAVIGGDGIGPEVVNEGLKVLEAVAGEVSVSTTAYDLGAARWHRTGETLPASVVEELKGHDGILLGAIGDPTVPSGVLERGVLLPLRFAMDHYVNLRPAKLYPGVASPLDVARVAPEGIDFVVVREGTEGPYVGNGGALRVDTPHEIATEVSVNTRFGVERVVRDAFARAQARPRKHLTLVHKHNVLVHAGHLWRRAVEAVRRPSMSATGEALVQTRRMAALEAALGPAIGGALGDPSVVEILINADGIMRVDRIGEGICPTEFALSVSERETAIRLLATEAGASVTTDHPHLSTILPNSGARVQALGHLAHPLAGSRVDVGQAAQRAGHGGGGDPGLARDVADGHSHGRESPFAGVRAQGRWA